MGSTTTAWTACLPDGVRRRRRRSAHSARATVTTPIRTQHRGNPEACDGVDSGLRRRHPRRGGGCRRRRAAGVCAGGLANDEDPTSGGEGFVELWRRGWTTTVMVPPTRTFDVDGDGVTTCAGDCDDGDAAVLPGADEVCNGDRRQLRRGRGRGPRRRRRRLHLLRGRLRRRRPGALSRCGGALQTASTTTAMVVSRWMSSTRMGTA